MKTDYPVEVWKGSFRFWIRIDRNKKTAWIEYPSGVEPKEIGIKTAECLIDVNGLQRTE